MPFVLADNLHGIALCQEHPALTFAADELTRYLYQSTPVVLHRCAMGDPQRSIEIGVSADDEMRRLLQRHGVALEQFDRPHSEAFATIVTHDSMVFCGARPRAALYAVYDFLERELGCVFAMPGVANEVVPQRAQWKVECGIHISSPAFPVRGYGFHDRFDAPFDIATAIDWLGKHRFNRVQIGLPHWIKNREQLAPLIAERDLDLDLGIHSLPFFLPEDEYLQEHPEWFASVVGRHGRQLRYANQESVPEVVRNISRFLESEPLVKVLGLWPLDGVVFEPDEIGSGQFGDLLLKYVNAVAQGVASEHPELIFDHLAYVGYAAPPREVVPHPAVMPSVCHYWDQNRLDPIYDCWFGRDRMANEERREKAAGNFHPLRDHRQCRDDLRGWIDLSPSIVFTYFTDLNLSQQHLFDLTKMLRADLQYYHAIGAAGCLDCSCSGNEWLWLAREHHALARHLWDPHCDWEYFDARLMKALFGQAAPVMAMFYASLEPLHKTPLLAGYRLCDSLARGIICHSLAGYQPELHEAVLQQIIGLFQKPFDRLEQASTYADDEARQRIRAIRSNLERQQVHAQAIHHFIGFLEYSSHVEITPADRHQIEIVLSQAEAVLENWECTGRSQLPDWAAIRNAPDPYVSFLGECRAKLESWNT